MLEVGIDPLRGLSVAYDREADEALLTDGGMIVRYRRGEVVGLAVLHFSERVKGRREPASS